MKILVLTDQQAAMLASKLPDAETAAPPRPSKRMCSDAGYRSASRWHKDSANSSSKSSRMIQAAGMLMVRRSRSAA